MSPTKDVNVETDKPFPSRSSSRSGGGDIELNMNIGTVVIELEKQLKDTIKTDSGFELYMTLSSKTSSIE